MIMIVMVMLMVVVMMMMMMMSILTSPSSLLPAAFYSYIHHFPSSISLLLAFLISLYIITIILFSLPVMINPYPIPFRISHHSLYIDEGATFTPLSTNSSLVDVQWLWKSRGLNVSYMTDMYIDNAQYPTEKTGYSQAWYVTPSPSSHGCYYSLTMPCCCC